MKGAIGVLLTGGGVLLLIALFSGQLKFPFGQVNILGSTVGNPLAAFDPNNPYGIFGSQFTGLQMNPQSGTNVQGTKFTQPDKNNNCPNGYYKSMLAGGKSICLQGKP